MNLEHPYLELIGMPVAQMFRRFDELKRRKPMSAADIERLKHAEAKRLRKAGRAP